MGCGCSAGGLTARPKKIPKGVVAGKDRTAEDAAETSARDSKVIKNDDYDIIAAVAASPGAVCLTDYRGAQVCMTNATPGRVNSICRWLDDVLSVKERNGGWIINPRGEFSAIRWDAPAGSNDSCVTMMPENDAVFSEKLNVSTYATGMNTSLRHLEKSQASSRTTEILESPLRVMVKLKSPAISPVLAEAGFRTPSKDVDEDCPGEKMIFEEIP